MTVKAFLRRLIVSTSFPPIVGIYRVVYRLLIRAAVWRLRQAASVRAIYLRRGLATGDGVPGISDIDLAAVGDWNAEAQARVIESYERFARWCPLYDPTVGVYSPASIDELYEADPFHRHRLSEGQREWKLLFGDDCLSHLAAIPREEASFGYEAELKLWWSYFARWAYASNDSFDEIFLNSLCYKVAAECFRMDCGLSGKPVPNSRRRAIDEAIAGASGEVLEFLAKIRASAQGRHLRYAGNVVEDTQSYVLGSLEHSYGRLETLPGWREIPAVCIRIEGTHEERELPEWPGFRVTSVSGTAFAMDELVFVFEPLTGRLPRAVDLQKLVSHYSKALSSSHSRVSLYLRLPNACYQLYASDYFRGWQAVLSPRFNPDLFPMAPWTRPAADFIRRERQLIAQALEDRAVYKANHLDFLRTFWKFLQLAVVEATAQGGEIVFAQTPEAVIRGLEQSSLPSAPFLPDFAAAYRNELRGVESNIGRQVPAAILYLKSIHHAL